MFHVNLFKFSRKSYVYAKPMSAKTAQFGTC